MISARDYILKVGSESVLFAHKADLLLEADEPDKALELCEQGVKRFPFYVEGYIQLARCYQFKNLNEEAVKAYQHALTLQPNHVKALKGLAYLYYKMREKVAGERTLLKAYLFNPQDQELREFLENEGLLSKLYQQPKFEEEQKESTKSGEMLLELEEILDDTRPTDEDERNHILEEIEEHPNVGEEDLFDSELNAKKEIEQIDESIFEVESEIGEEEDTFPEDLAAVTPEMAQNKPDESEKQTNSSDPEETAPPQSEDREEFTQWMSDLFKPDEQTNLQEKEQTQKKEPEKSETNTSAEPVVNDLDTILIFSDHRNSESKNDDENEQEEIPLGDFNALEEDIERISSTEFSEIEKHMVEPETSEPAEEEPEEKSTEVGEVLKRLEESEKKRDESALRKAQLNELESQAENENVDIDDILSNPSLLTPTFGEILIAQHKFEDALKVFKALAQKEPENQRIKKKIEFLKKLVMAKK